MNLKNYSILCAGVSLLTIVVVLFVPGVSQTLETLLIGFLSSTAN